MKKIEKIFIFFHKTIITSIVTALGVYTIGDEWNLLLWVCHVFVALIAISCFIYELIERKKTIEKAKETIKVNQQEIEKTLVILEKIRIDKSKFAEIIELHIQNLKQYFGNVFNRIETEILSEVTLDTIKRLDKAKDDQQRQNIINSIISRISNLNDVERVISKEHKECFNKLEKYLLDWAKTNRILNQKSKTRIKQGREKYSSSFRAEIDDLVGQISKTRNKYTSPSLGKLVFHEKTINEMAITGVLASLGISLFDTGDNIEEFLPGDGVYDHILDNVLHHVGITVSTVMPYILIARVLYYLYQNRDRTQELEELQNSILQSSKQYMNLISDSATNRVKVDSNAFIEDLKIIYTNRHREAIIYVKKARKFVG
jgi:hypothetical protein